MNVISKKKEVFGKIGAVKTLTEGLPKLKLSSSFASINNSGDVISFLTDLVKTLVGFEALVSSVIDTITHSLPRIEKEVKKALKVELKNIVSCGVNPSLPSWMKSTGPGINIQVKKIDFADILRTDPNSVAGQLIYNDITTPLVNSTDFNTFLYGVIQDEGIEYSWKNIITFKFVANGAPFGFSNNSLIIKADQAYDNKTLTDLNNDFIDSLILFNSDNVVNKVMDIIYGTVSSTIGKSFKQLESEAQINTIIDKMVANNDKNPIPDSAFSFTKEETYKQQAEALARKKGSINLKTTNDIPSSVPISQLTDFTQQFKSAGGNVIQQKDAIKNGLTNMANASALNVPNPIDVVSSKLNFIQQIIVTLIKSIVNIVLSPKVILTFVLNYKIVYGPQATFTNGVDFIKKNKNLMNRIMKVIAEELIKILLAIALKEIAVLVSKAMAKKQKEKVTLKLAQLQSLIGVPTNIIQQLLGNLI
jgi:F0F1-type ATP synthase assembly protein I